MKTLTKPHVTMAGVIRRIFGVLSLWITILLVGATAASAAPPSPPLPSIDPDYSMVEGSGLNDFVSQLLGKYAGVVIWGLWVLAGIFIITGIILMITKGKKGGIMLVGGIVAGILAAGGLNAILKAVFSLG